MSTDIELAGQIRLAEEMSKASLLPDAYRKQPANILWAMEMADALGLRLPQAINGIAVINGKPTMSAELMRSLVVGRGHRFVVTEYTDTAVTVTVARREWPDDVQAFTFTMKDADKAGLSKSATYQKHPKSMLLARATSAACRAVFPDVLSGVSYTPEEMEDVTPAAPRVDTTRFTPTVSVTYPGHNDPAPEPETVTLSDDYGEIDPQEIIDAEAIEEPKPLTATQSARITRAITALKLGKTDGLALYSEVVGRPIKATRDLNSDEAEQVLAHLETLTGPQTVLETAE